MSTLPLKAFRSLVDLSDEEIVEMLDHGTLPIVLSQTGEVRVVIEKVDEALIANRPAPSESAALKQHAVLIEEVIASETALAIDEMLNDVIDILDRKLSRD